MKVYRNLLVVLFFLTGMPYSFAQQMTDVEKYISAGNYQGAMEVLETMELFEPGKYTDLMTKVSNCRFIQREARSLFQKEYYTKAIEKYRLIKRYFPSDRTVDAAIRQCEIKRDEYNRMQEQKRREEQARQARSAEDAQWQRAVIVNTKVGYIDYLNKYPVGKYSNTARTRLFDLYVNDAQKCYSSRDYRGALNSFEMASRYGTLSLMFGRMYRIAKEKIEEQQEDSRYAALMSSAFPSPVQLETFLKDYPQSRHCTMIRGKLLDRYCELGRFDDARRLVEDNPKGIALTADVIPDVDWWMKNIRQRERKFRKDNDIVHPRFKGKDRNAFSEWVNERLVYPETARKKGIEGTVKIQFTIDIDGSVKDVKVIEGINFSLDIEAVRVVSMSPKWKPGKKDGKPIRVTYTFPVVFQLK